LLQPNLTPHQPTPRRFRLDQPGLHRLTPRQQLLDLGHDPFWLGEHAADL
jgi:hypothetical protein